MPSRRFGVDVRLKQAVTRCAATGVTLGDENVCAGTVAGVAASPAADWFAGKDGPPPFRYRDQSKLATVGRKTAVIAFKRLQLKGWFAWWIWGIARIYFLVSLRNRLIVMTQWLWSYVSAERDARLITGLRTTLEPAQLGRALDILGTAPPERQKAGSVSEVIGPRPQIARKSLKKVHYK
jgi:hypothetical protein